MAVTPQAQKQQDWIQRLEQWQQSGLSQKDWCQANQIPVHQFSYWKQKLLNKAVDQQARPGSQSQRFIPVQIQPGAYPSSMESLTLQLPGGLTISGIAEHNLGTVQALIKWIK